MTLRSALALSLLLAGLMPPSAAAVTGEMRTLYVLATWGPVPFSNDDLMRVLPRLLRWAIFNAALCGRPGAAAEGSLLEL